MHLRTRGSGKEMGGESGFLCICGPQAVRPVPRVALFLVPRPPSKH